MKDKAERIDCPKCLEGYMVKIKGVQQCNNRCGNTLLPAAYEEQRRKFLAAKKKKATKRSKPRAEFCGRCANTHMPTTACTPHYLLNLFKSDGEKVTFSLEDLIIAVNNLKLVASACEIDPEDLGIKVEVSDTSLYEEQSCYEFYASFYKINEEEPITEEEQ